MSSTYISTQLRRGVANRAHHHCQYCLLHQEDEFYGCHVDHIISEKHGGRTAEDNLAFACSICNRNKGSDIGSIVPGTGALIRLFHPCVDRWDEHFRLRSDSVIEPISPVGEATARILGFNTPDRIEERQTLNRAGRYPPVAARRALDGG